MIVSQMLRLINADEVGRVDDSKCKHTSSNSFFCRAFCFSCSPSRTCLAARFRSSCRTAASPFPSLALPAASMTRPARAFLRCAGVRLRSGLREPDRSCVCTSRCSNASFCVLVLCHGAYQHHEATTNWQEGDAARTSRPHPHRKLFACSATVQLHLE